MSNDAVCKVDKQTAGHVLHMDGLCQHATKNLGDTVTSKQSCPFYPTTETRGLEMHRRARATQHDLNHGGDGQTWQR